MIKQTPRNLDEQLTSSLKSNSKADMFIWVLAVYEQRAFPCAQVKYAQ